MRKFINTCKLKNIFLNNHWIKEETKREMRRYFKTNEDENTAYQNFAKLGTKKYLITLPLEKEKSQVNNLTLYLKVLEKEERTQPRVSRMKEMIKIRAEINELGHRKVVGKNK